MLGLWYYNYDDVKIMIANVVIDISVDDPIYI